MPDDIETTDEDWDKAVGQFRLHLASILKPLRIYGQEDYVNRALEEIVNLSIQLHLKLYGIDEPFYIDKGRLHW